jgi:hypothetical protein
MKKFFRRLLNITKDRTRALPGGAQQKGLLAPMLNGVHQTLEVEYDCDDVYRLMDQYVELLRRGEDTSTLMPLVAHHLRMCGDCREEVQALVRMMDAQLPDEGRV